MPQGEILDISLIICKVKFKLQHMDGLCILKDSTMHNRYLQYFSARYTAMHMPRWHNRLARRTYSQYCYELCGGCEFEPHPGH